MQFPRTGANIRHYKDQAMQMLGINLTDNYANGQLENSHNIGTGRYPYISTADRMEEVETGITSGYKPISMFAWEKLFVVSNEPNALGTGYKCYYGGAYCGDVKNLDPKQYAVVNSKLCVFPDRVMFELYEGNITSQDMNTSENVFTVTDGVIDYRRAD